MAVIELTDVLFYRGGQSGFSKIVGNDWMDGHVTSRVARYTFTAPAEGAQRVKVTFYTIGREGGDYHIPIRFFIGTDPNSHADAGAGSEYTGELILGGDWMTFTAEAEILLLPGKTYYFWLFPGSEVYSYYGWAHPKNTSILETEGSACVIPIVRNGSWWLGLGYCKYKGNLWLCAVYVCRGGKWYLCGAP